MDNRKLYRRVYDLKNPIHPKKGALGLYGAETIRDPFFLAAVKERLSPGMRVLDASCGRGHLLEELLKAGYKAEGTEIVELPELDEFCFWNVSYQELYQFDAGTFDGVISNDVLEHLDVEDLDVALANLCRISNGWLFFSVGTVPAHNFPTAEPSLGVKDLHKVVQGDGWWRERFKRFIDIDTERITRRTYFAYGRKRTWLT